MADEVKEYTLEELEKSLDEKQRKFAHAYIFDWAKARSYMKAYPDSTYEAAAVSANRLLKNAKIIQYIEFIKDDIAKEAGLSKLMLVSELKKFAFNGFEKIHNTWITRNEFETLSDDVKACIQEIDTKVYKKNLGTERNPDIVDVEHIKIKLVDRKGAIQDLAKMMGWNEAEKIDHSTLGEKIQQPSIVLPEGQTMKTLKEEISKMITKK